MNPDAPQTSPQPSPAPSRSPLVAGIIAVAILVLVIGGISLASNGDEPVDTVDTSSQTSDNDTETTAEGSSDGTAKTDTGSSEETVYTDGSYEGSGTYTSPGGTEAVKVRLTLEGNRIADATVTTDPASPTSRQYQNEFKSGYKALVVGKNIDEVKLSKVSGSSLTSQGFNAAIQQIKQQAQAG